MPTIPAPDPERVRPLVARVEQMHRRAKLAGKVRPSEPPRERLPLDVPERRDLG